MKPILRVICVIAFGLTALSAAPRTWTNLSGQKLEAELVELTDTTVRLKLVPGGRMYNLEIKQLSEADQAFLTEERARLAEAAKAADLAKRDGEWTEDWEAAQKEATATGLPILLLMTGSDWCPPCMALEYKVFESRDFKKFAKESVVLMKADFPNGNQRASTKKQNAELKAKFTFSGFPTVFLLKPDLTEIGKKTGYGGTSPEDYIDDLKKMLKN